MLIRAESKVERFLNRWESLGTSFSLYLLIGVILLGLWQFTPLPSPDWKSNRIAFGWIAFLLVGITSLHGVMWGFIVQPWIPLKPAAKRFLSTSIRFVRPLHMMTGLLALGLVIIHSFPFLGGELKWDSPTWTGLIGLAALLILTLDGIGLMVSPFLSRTVHRIISLFFILVLILHLVFVM